jgi:PAS domain S-box-containing protein
MTASTRVVAGGLRRRDAPASPTERGVAVVFAAVLVLTALVAYPLRQHPVGIVPGFLAAYGALLFSTEIATALILIWWSRRDRATAALAAVYAFSAPLIAANVVTLPGVILPPGAVAFQVPVWMWAIWHVGWPVGMVLYAWLPPPRSAAPRIVAGALISIAAIEVVLVLGPHLPVLIAPATLLFSPLLIRLASVGIVFCAIALAGFLRRRDLSNLELWLMLAVLALSLDASFTLVGQIRFSLGSYLARMMGAASGIIVFAALIYEYGRLLRQVDFTARLAGIAEALPQLVFATDRRGACIYVNAAFATYTGREASDALERGWIESVHHDDLPIALEMVRLAVTRGTSPEVEFRLRAENGAYRWHLASTTALKDADGTASGLLGTAVDIDERYRAADEVTRLYAREHRIVETLQAAFLPSFLPLLDGARFDAVYLPASREASVGGDWYDAFVIGEGRIGICVGDVTGHGLDAASTMVRTRETVRAVAMLAENAPSNVLALAHRSLTARSGAELTTALFATFDAQTRRLAYACAGHPPPILVRGGTSVTLAGGGVPFGVLVEPDIEEHELVLEAGDMLAFYTDGLIEAERDVERGERQLLEALLAPNVEAAAVVARLVGRELRDDVALLLLHVGTSAAPAQRGWSFRSDDAASAQPARASFLAYVIARGMPPEAANIAELVFGELVGNVVRHAPGPIEIDLNWADGRPQLQVRDRGPGFAPSVPALPADALSESGRGLFLVRAFAGEPQVTPRAGGGMEVRVELTTGAASAVASG